MFAVADHYSWTMLKHYIGGYDLNFWKYYFSPQKANELTEHANGCECVSSFISLSFLLLLLFFINPQIVIYFARFDSPTCICLIRYLLLERILPSRDFFWYCVSHIENYTDSYWLKIGGIIRDRPPPATAAHSSSLCSSYRVPRTRLGTCTCTYNYIVPTYTRNHLFLIKLQNMFH